MNIWIVALMAGFVFWLVYYVLVRRYLLDSAEFELRQMGRTLDWAVINGLDGAESELAKKLERNFKAVQALRWISFGQVMYLYYVRRNALKVENERETQMLKRSPLWLRDLWANYVRVIVKATLANSPMWWVPLAILLLVAVFSQQVEMMLRDVKIAAADINPVCA